MDANRSEDRFVKHATQNTRLRYITAYLSWLTTISMSRVSRDSGLYQNTMAAKQDMISLLDARQAHSHRPTQNRLLAPKGFSKDVQDKIIDVIKPDHPENPWTLPFSKIRNQVYLLMSICTGLRAGESLCIKMHDLDFANQTFQIVRRPDDPDDTRKIKPEVKTKERYLPIGNGWLCLLRAYVRQRGKLIKTKSSREIRRNPYLFVSKHGTPLTLRGAGDIFIELRNAVSDFPEKLTQHMVRKAWNTRLSEYLEEIDDIGLEHKDFIRKYLMGWSRNSKMPELYNLEYVIKQAGKLSLDIQQKAIMR
jgi:integrase